METELSIVPGACRESAAALAAVHSRKSSHSANPGGSLMRRAPLARQAYIRAAIGTARKIGR